jgi:FlaA1/EpsC-like NDP-sugar epimerase
MKTIILGSGYLSDNLKKKITNSYIVSANNILEIRNINKKKKKFNLIVNSFYKSSELYKIDNYSFFFQKSLVEVCKFLDVINPRLIEKIIYTSSAAVYNSVSDNFIKKDSFNRKLYSSTKINMENLFSNFSNKHNIPFSILRIFNMYGPGEKFSIISKIIDSFKLKEKIEIANNGHSIRDFIHIYDVVKLYKILLKQKNDNIFDIGTGIGTRILDIVNSIKKIKIKKIVSKIDEITNSIANVNNFKRIKPKFKFISLQFYLQHKLKNNFKSQIIQENYTTKNRLSKNITGSIIYGCGYAGVRLAKSLLSLDPNNVYCFVDDDFSKVGESKYGKKIISYDNLLHLSRSNSITNIIIAIPSLDQNELKLMYKKLFSLATNISVLPSKKELINKEITFENITEIDVSNFINRKTFLLNKNILCKFLNKSILVTGGGGSIGSELCKQILQGKPKKLVVLEHSEFALYKIVKNLDDKNPVVVPILGDVNDLNLLKKLVVKYKFNYVYHAAAYKHVNLLEQNVISGIKNNIFGTVTLLESLKNIKTNLSIISTDKAVQPKSILGYSKRFSEIFCQTCSQDSNYKKLKLSVIRFGNVFGSDGSVIQLFINQLKNNQSITITDRRAERYFMSIREACNLVLQSSHLKTYKNSIFVLDMGKPIKIIQILRKIIDFFGYDYNKVNILEKGLYRGEKLKEKLSHKNLIQTNNNNIMIANDPIYKINKVYKCLNNLRDSVNKYESTNTTKILKDFFK